MAGSVGWVLAGEESSRALGRVLWWARRFPLSELHLLAEDEAGVLARRAGAFADAPFVWRIEGTELRPAEPSPFPPSSPEGTPSIVVFLLSDRPPLMLR